MQVELFNEQGTHRVITVEVPDEHAVACDVILWGDRTFVQDDRTERFVERELYVVTTARPGPVK